ncbi:hypothetical protein ACHWQZ_G002185 [Mnemiopsis leidyi]
MPWIKQPNPAGIRDDMILILLALLHLSSSHILDSLLKSYSTLHRDDLDIRYYPNNVILLTLQIENVTYTSTLSPHTEIFHKHFKTVLLNSNSSSTLENARHGHYIGRMDTVRDSRIVIHMTNDGLVTGNIELNNEIYYIEPSWRHISELHDFHMIVYKKSDVFFRIGHNETGQFCAHESHKHSQLSSRLLPLNNTPSNTDSGFTYDTRFKRAIRVRNTCEVILIADYKFFSTIGGSDEQQTKTYLIAIFERINQIFRSSQFETSDRKFSGYGMQIRNIVIHQDSSSDPTDYNFLKNNWDVSDMLDAFGYGTERLNEKWSDYCLAHLYTNYDFRAGVLGLAYVASPVSNKVGGICSVPYLSGSTNKRRMLNIGLSTSINYDRTLLSSELELVSAHEIGHNWGSSHDPDNADICAPPGNHFLMYPSAVDGSRSNNKRFSPCSLTAIASVLKYKSGCFLEQSRSFCGNGIIEEEEECDPGPENTSDECCTEQCKFTPGSVCSDRNNKCCDKCQLAGSTKVCYSSAGEYSDVINGCILEKRCNNERAACDVITYKAVGSPCFDEGSCDDNGNCLDFCLAKGETLCRGHGNDTCYWMCVDPDLGTCSKKYTVLPDGKPCPNGVCVAGECLVEPQTQVKIWQILSGLTPSIFWQWMKNNVVLVVIVLTSLFWVPLSIFVNWLDRGYDEVDYCNTMTLQRKKEALRTQKSTVSSKSFELRTIVNMEPSEEDNNVFSLTGARF